MTNDIARRLALFDGFEPFRAYVPRGYCVDFIGALSAARCGIDPLEVGGFEVTMPHPSPKWGAPFFEAASWFAAARAARGSFTMIELGFGCGAAAVDAYLVLQRLNPMSARLVVVEPDAENFAWIKQHFGDNAIDPDRHWLINCAIGDNNKPVPLPLGAGSIAGHDYRAAGGDGSLRDYAEAMASRSDAADILRALILNGRTEMPPPGRGEQPRANLQFVSTVTLNDILAPLGSVDLLEIRGEPSTCAILVSAMDLIMSRVKRVHIATQTVEAHAQLLSILGRCGFSLDGDYSPNTRYESPWGVFEMKDGVIAAVNPDL